MTNLSAPPASKLKTPHCTSGPDNDMKRWTLSKVGRRTFSSMTQGWFAPEIAPSQMRPGFFPGLIPARRGAKGLPHHGASTLATRKNHCTFPSPNFLLGRQIVIPRHHDQICKHHHRTFAMLFESETSRLPVWMCGL